MEQLKKQEATSSMKDSFELLPAGAKIPETKALAQEYLELDSKISLSRDMLNNMIMYFRDIGAEKTLPSKKEKLYEYLNHFHEQLAVKNPYWPEDLPFGYIYGAFFNRIIQGYIEINGFNIRSHSVAFRKWAESGNIKRLRDAYYRENEDEAKNQIESKTQKEPDEETKKLKAEGYVNFSPDVVKRQVGILKMMYGGSFEKALADVEGMKSYRRRLHNTYEKYKEEGKITEESERQNRE